MATVDRLTDFPVEQTGPLGLPELLAGGRLAFAMQRYARAESCMKRVITFTEAAAGTGYDHQARAAAFRGLAQVKNQLRDYDGGLAAARTSVELGATPD